MGKKTKYELTVKPAIPLHIRHKIEKLLEMYGYEVYVGGTWHDMSSCDITFSEKDKENDEEEEGKV